MLKRPVESNVLGKKKDTCSFCGTHEKCQPHGIVTPSSNEKTLKRCCITIVDINGINYYVDDNNNVYNTADILTNSTNPKIIGVVKNDGAKQEFKAL